MMYGELVEYYHDWEAALQQASTGLDTSPQKRAAQDLESDLRLLAAPVIKRASLGEITISDLTIRLLDLLHQTPLKRID